MENDLWDRLIKVLKELAPDISKIGKKRNRGSCERVRKNTWKAIRYLKAINALANTF